MEGPVPPGLRDVVERVPPIGVDFWAIFFTRFGLFGGGHGPAPLPLHILPRARLVPTPTRQTPHHPKIVIRP
jgi:hypothetical protein